MIYPVPALESRATDEDSAEPYRDYKAFWTACNSDICSFTGLVPMLNININVYVNIDSA